MRRFFTIFAALFAFVGCSQDDVVTSNAPIEKPTYYASFADAEADSRTYLDENFMLLWHNDDRISLFATTYNEEYAFADATGSNSGAFNAVDKDSYVTGNAISTTYAVYPYNAANAISNSEILTIHFPAEQSYAEDSFGRGANTMVAAAQSSSSKLLPFRNAGGYMMLKLYGENKTVKSIELKGNNEEVISGAATAEAKYGYLPLITMGAEGGKSITLTCENAVELGATEAEATTFWIVVPPITFEQGFTITVTNADGGTYTKSTSKPTTINRNEIKSMSALAPTFTGETENPENTKPANNEIWYTSTDGKIVEPYDSTGFGANIVSNTYENGKGVITFDSEVTKIGDEAFWRKSLASIILPNSVTKIESYAFQGTPIKDITLPANLTTIGGCAFYGCGNLTSITIPESVVGIGSRVFSACGNLTAFYGKYASEDNRCLISDNLADIGKIYLDAFAPKGITEYAIPDVVTIIGEEVFYDADELEYVIIPDSVKQIESDAFESCSNLKSVVIGSGVTGIDFDDFDSCNSLECICLKSTTPPRLSSYNGYLFNYCQPTLYVPIESIDDYKAHSEWSELTATLNIEGSHFATTSEIHYTSNDGNIVEPDTDLFGAKIISNTYNDGKGVIKLFGYVMKLAHRTFLNCNNLSSISLPSSVTSLESYTFYECPNLTSVIIPECVNFMDSYTFHKCKNISTIYFKAQNPPVLDHPAFFDNGLTPRIYVPSNSVSAYKNADKWTFWADLIVGYNFE